MGFVGTPKGWTIVVGGNAASKPRIAEVLAEGLTTDDALSLTEKLMAFYKGENTPKRLGVLMDKIGIDEIKKGVGVS